MIDVPPELRRRIRVAAAKQDASVRDYVVGILEREVPSEPERPRGRGRVVIAEMVERLRETREAIMRGRAFSDDSTDLINEGREQRTAEL